jgi:hypothetical protein
VSQGSDKQCRLTQRGIQKLENALKNANGGSQPSNTWIAETYGIDRGTVADVINRQKPVTRSSIAKLFDPLDLDLLDEDYEFWLIDSKKSNSPSSNPFEQTDLWGCDELLRRIFERLRQGGSQALIGPAGCGKTEILRLLEQQQESQLQRPIFSLNMHLIRDERSFFDRLCNCFELEPHDSLSRVPLQVERELKRRKQSHVLCLDEIHVLTNEAFFPEATRNWLKGMADEVYPLQLVVSSQRNLRELFPDNPNRSSPLADFFAGQTEWLEHWDVGKVGRFVNDRLSGMSVKFAPKQIEEIHQKSDGKPKLVRDLAAAEYCRITQE